MTYAVFEYDIISLNSTLECNFISKQEGCDSVESAHFNHVKKSGTDENLQLAHPNRTFRDFRNEESQYKSK